MEVTGLSRREKFSYGLGDFASHMCWDMTAGFLLYFYTDVAGIAIATTGTLMLVTRVFDALIDPAIGSVVDRTSSRHGKARPYLLYGALPFGLLLVALFVVPFHTEPARTIYAYVTLNLIGIVYSFLNIPYSALMALMTRNTHEKMQLSSYRTIGSSVGTFVVTSATIPLVHFFGPGLNRGFLMTAALFAGLSTGLFLLVFANCRERYKEPAPAKARSVNRSVGNLLRNGPWLASVSAGALLLMRLGAMLAITIYFAIHVLHNPWMISALLPLISVTWALAAVVSPPYFKRMGIRRGNILALIVSAACFAFLPMLEGKTWAFLALYGVSSFIVGVCPTALFAMVADSVDYQQWKFGNRDDGLIFSSMSLVTKVGMALGGSLIAFALARAHFDPKAVTVSMQGVIRDLYYWTPPMLMLLQTIPMMFYKLDKLHPQIVRELAARSSALLDPVKMASEQH